MAVKITPKFTGADIQMMLKDKMQRVEEAVLMRLQLIGETFVKNARENANFTDHTGNLRSSIGYIVLRDGEQYTKGGFVKILAGDGGTEQGDKVLEQAALKYPRGLVLIVVAGMDYAAAVESKGKDVLTASSLIAKADLKKAIQTLGEKMGRMQ
jgi:hypothetical protein